MLVNKTITEFIKDAGSDAPTPGGGSVAALAGSLGSALTTMVANLSFDKKAYKELDSDVKSKFDDNFKRMEELTEELTKIIDEDSNAFDGVMKAFGMPKETEEEKAKRSEAIQEGYKEAIEVPHKCARLCLEILELQDVFAEYGNVNAITDVGVGALLAYTGLEGALLNVTINLSSIKDEDFRNNTAKTVEDQLNKGKELRDQLMKVVYERLN